MLLPKLCTIAWGIFLEGDCMIRALMTMMVMITLTTSCAEQVRLDTRGNTVGLTAGDTCYFDTELRHVVCIKSSGERVIFNSVRTHAESMNLPEDYTPHYIGYFTRDVEKKTNVVSVYKK